jgi:hypothetical protein
MKPEDQNEDELQRILSLKKREQPPPRFFHRLSEKIIDRLHTPEPPSPPTWRQRMGLDFDTKPVLICVSGVAVCTLLVCGLISSTRVKPPPLPANDSAQNSSVPVSPIAGQIAQPNLATPRIVRPEEAPRSVDPALADDPSSPNRFTVRPKPAGFNPDVPK